MKRIVVLWAFLFGLLPLARSQGNVVTASLSLAHDQLLPDEKMHLKVAVQNRSGQDLKLGAASDYITFVVLDEKKSQVAPLGTNQVYTDGEFTLPTGETATREFNLTPFFDFRRPGAYSVKATIRIPQWKQMIDVPPVTFTVVNGIRLPNVPDLAVGVVRGQSDQPPEVRRYFLEKADTGGGMNLYVRLTDASGGRTLRLVPVGLYFPYTEPDVKLDHFNVLHLLHQTGAQTFTYYTIDTLGLILERQTYLYTDRRPVLDLDEAGGVLVKGGVRKILESDLPPPEKHPVASSVVFPGANGK